jgi:hypothetical protein
MIRYSAWSRIGVAVTQATAPAVSALPSPELFEQSVSHLRIDRIRRQMSEGLHRFPHLMQVGAAVAAHSEMRLESQTIEERQPMFQIIRHKLGEFLAANHGGYFRLTN